MIGIYDSGIGGLGIFKKIRGILPYESITYFADSAHFPFGDRDKDEIRSITLTALQKLEQTCDVIIIACNTASVNDIDYYRNNITAPIIAVVPVIKTAAHVTDTNHIALLATTSTNSASYTDNLIQQFANTVTVEKISCSGLADAVEYDDVNKQRLLLEDALKNLGDIDVIVLGCTHYTLIKGLIQNIAGPEVKILDSNTAVARHALRIMHETNVEQPQNTPEYIFLSSNTDDASYRERITAILQTL